MQPTVSEITESVLCRLTDGNPDGPVASRWLPMANSQLETIIGRLYDCQSVEVASVNSLIEFIKQCEGVDDGRWQSLAFSLLAQRPKAKERLLTFIRSVITGMLDDVAAITISGGAPSSVDKALDVVARTDWLTIRDYCEMIAHLRGKSGQFREGGKDFLQAARIWRRRQLLDKDLAQLLGHYVSMIAGEDGLRDGVYSLLVADELSLDVALTLANDVAHVTVTAIGAIHDEGERRSVENNVEVSRAFVVALLQELFSTEIAEEALAVFERVIFERLSHLLAGTLTSAEFSVAEAEQTARLMVHLGDDEAKDALVRRCQHWAATARNKKDHLERVKILTSIYGNDQGLKALQALQRYSLCNRKHGHLYVRLAYELALASTFEVKDEKIDMKNRIERFFEDDTLGTAHNDQKKDRARHRSNLDAIEDLLAQLRQ